MTSIPRRYIAHYQPKICLSTGALLGHEALLRQRYESVLISPGAIFAGLDGEHLNDLLLETTSFVLDDVGRVMESKLSPGISMNIPPSMLANSDVIDLFVSRADSLKGMTIEILEYPGPTIPCMIAACQVLMESGYRIAMDDFGEGESNLVRLIALSPQEVKLDAKLLAFRDGRKILPALVNVIKETGATICVEGVESQEDHRLAIEAGANSAQGFYYGMPSPL